VISMIRNKYHYGVVVGINAYPGGYKALSGSVNDACKFADWLTDPLQGGLPTGNVKKILTPVKPPVRLPGAKPTKTLVDDAIWEARQKLCRALQKAPEEEQSELRRRSRLYIFVAGHGMMPGGNIAALLDAKAVRGKQTNLELKSYVEWLVKDGQFAEVCVFADCCRNYELLAEPGLPPFDRPGEPGGKVMFLLSLSTTAGRMSFEDTDESIPADERRGYFSRALVEGLRGNAADPKTGIVTHEDLRTYVDKVVSERTSKKPLGLRQEIENWQSGGELTFGPPRMPAARTSQQGMLGPRGRELRKVIIRFDTHLRGRVELVSPDGSTQVWDPQDGPWIVWLYDGTWYVQHEGRPMDTSGFANSGFVQITGEDRDVQL
jgi:hypothetical protein